MPLARPKLIRTVTSEWHPETPVPSEATQGSAYFNPSELDYAAEGLLVLPQGLVMFTFTWTPLAAAEGQRSTSGVTSVLVPFTSSVVAMSLSASAGGKATFTSAGAPMVWSTGSRMMENFRLGAYDIAAGEALTCVASAVTGTPNVEVNVLLAQASTA